MFDFSLGVLLLDFFLLENRRESQILFLSGEIARVRRENDQRLSAKESVIFKEKNFQERRRRRIS